MQRHTTLLTTPGRKRRGGRMLVLLLLALTGAGGWWVFKRKDSNSKQRLDERAPSTNIVADAVADSSPRILPTNALTPVWRTPPSATHSGTGAVTTVLEAQVALDRLALSPGSIDGVLGSQTRAALQAFQARENLAVTGALDAETRARLTLLAPPLVGYRIQPADVARLRPLAATWLGKSQQEHLDYETLLELVAERSHAHPALIQKLNPTCDWEGAQTGLEVLVLAVDRVRLRPQEKAAFIQIHLGARTLRAFDSANRLLAHFPCSIARRVDKRPVGELHVAVVAPNPDYTFDPELFPESAEARAMKTKLKLPPGPNNPVGTAWIGLNLPGYGIHGTPRPEEVGRTESHGCFRLANWNAEYLLQLVTLGTPVRVEP